MIQLPTVAIPDTTRQELAELQRKVNGAGVYAAQVTAAKKHFSLVNKPNNRTFRVVRRKLEEMCSGALRCVYCEDSRADEVEHIRPKDLYPEQVFAWANYVYACGPCNGPKNNQFAVFSLATGNLVEVTRKRNQPVEPPENGEHAFIDPRQENPLDLLDLDLVDTFRFLPMVSEKQAKENQKADYTIRVLRLNERDDLVRARKEAYGDYRARLKEYISERDNGASPNALANLIKALLRKNHPTVWAEMKRQRDFIPELSYLFAKAPEALNW
jgi:uncharacterized protein (TIGR02646 family)